MRKIVVFVEGQTEQIFVRELLLRRFAYNPELIGIRCYFLRQEATLSAEYDFGNDDAENFFQVINAGGDNKVLSAMIKRTPRMLEAGYQIIIGLRDMYSRLYREESPEVVSNEKNVEIIQAARDSIHSALGNDAPVHIHYAIMEVETWMLALLEKWKGNLSKEQIEQILSPDQDLEHIYHPADVVKAITEIKDGQTYAKHAGQVNSIVSNIEWSDYQSLYDSAKCPAYNEFLEDLLEMSK